MDPGTAMMRAGSFIGVDKCGDLQKFNDTVVGAKRMHESAASESMLRNLPEKVCKKSSLIENSLVSVPLSALTRGNSFSKLNVIRKI
jgi:hypothetical protein